MKINSPGSIFITQISPSKLMHGDNHLCRSLILIFVFIIILQHSLPVLAADEVGRIVSIKGEVSVRSAGATRWDPAVVNQTLFAGDYIRTGLNAKAAILLSDETQMQINRDTLVGLKEVAQASGWHRLKGFIKTSIVTAISNYTLEKGEIWVRNNNRDLYINIDTTMVTAAIRGTEITMRIEPDERATIAVLEGIIEARNSLGSLTATTGEEVTATPGTAPRKRLLVQPEDAVQWTLSLPSLFTAHDFPLVSTDQDLLLREYASLSSSSTLNDPVVQVRLGQILRDLGRRGESMHAFQRVLDDDPANPEALTGAGWVLLDQGEVNQALTEFNRVNIPGSLNYLGRIAALAEQNRLVEAKVTLNAAQRQYPNDRLFTIQDAYLDLLDGNIRDSQSTLQALIVQDTGQPLAWELLSLVSVMLNEKEVSVQAADHAIALVPGSPTAHLIRSYAQQAIFDLYEAMNSVRRALVIDNQNVKALVDLARLEFGSDYLTEAWVTIEQAYALAPNDSEVLQLRGFIQLARGDLDEARDDLRRALEMNSELAEPWLGLSLIHMRQGEVAVAMEEIITAVLLDPQRSLFLSYWAKMLYQIKRFDKATDVLDRAQALDPRDPTVELYRAIILRDLNRPGEAIKALNKAMALNDSRGVYRSRYLLDQDLAVKNVDLSRLYSQLGLNTWAERKAVNSIKQDYLNHAGHLFYAGSLSEQEGRDYSFVSEQLLARLLMPANVNSFNTFNDYTSFFEEPDLDTNITATVGTQKTRNGDITFSGSLPDANLAALGGFFYESTDGWRDTNFEKLRSFAGIAKWQPTPQDGVMLAATRTSKRQGDEDFPRFEYDNPADPIERNNSDITRVELGFQHHFSPKSDILLYLAHLDIDGFKKDHETFTESFIIPPNLIIFFFPPFLGDRVNDIDFTDPFYTAQLQYMHKVSNHQLIAGNVQYWGDKKAIQNSITNLLYGGEPVIDSDLPFSESIRHKLNTRYESSYIQDIWRLSPTVTVEGAIYFDQMKNADATAGTSWTLNAWNPRLGLIFFPSPADTIRVAAFRYLVPFFTSRTDPTDIAGIPIIRNAEEGAVNNEIDFLWEHEWSTGMFTANIFSLNRRLKRIIISDNSDLTLTQHGDMDGVEIKLNQLLTDSIGLDVNLHHFIIEDESLPETNRNESEISVKASFLNANGLSGNIRQIYRYIDLENSRANESIPVTDLELGYEFSGKSGSVRLEVRNLFDKHFNWITDRFIFQGRAPEREIIGVISLNF